MINATPVQAASWLVIQAQLTSSTTLNAKFSQPYSWRGSLAYLSAKIWSGMGASHSRSMKTRRWHMPVLASEFRAFCGNLLVKPAWGKTATLEITPLSKNITPYAENFISQNHDPSTPAILRCSVITQNKVGQPLTIHFFHTLVLRWKSGTTLEDVSFNGAAWHLFVLRYGRSEAMFYLLVIFLFHLDFTCH